jgi:outer membrane protein OmpA-like peptidoglycan-associated protein
MFGSTIKAGGKARDEAEKPFWISYADLMTALMVLFLVAMTIALLAITRKVRNKSAFDNAVKALLDDVQQAADRYPGVSFDRDRRVIDFGRRALFPYKEYRLAPDQARYLRNFTPEVLSIADSPRGKDLLKRVVVEGFTDKTGTYLYNLNLSLQRSESVLCALLGDPDRGESPLTEDQRRDIQDLFLVGGFSFNSARATLDESRRIELRLEIRGYGPRQPVVAPHAVQNLGKCALNP